MSPAIASQQASNQGVGAALAQPQSAPGQSGQTAPDPSGAQQGAGMDAMTQQTNQTLALVRQLGQATKALMDMVPTAADEVAQIQELLKAVVVKAAAGAPMTSASGMAVPGNGGGA